MANRESYKSEFGVEPYEPRDTTTALSHIRVTPGMDITLFDAHGNELCRVVHGSDHATVAVNARHPDRLGTNFE